MEGRFSRRPLAVGYVAVVVVLAAVGFAWHTALLFAAVLLALPAAVVAVPGIYLVAGLVAFVPGANPPHASGAGFADAQGHTVVTGGGGPATWYLAAIGVAGVVLLALAALGNVLLLDLVRRRRKGAPAA